MYTNALRYYNLVSSGPRSRPIAIFVLAVVVSLLTLRNVHHHQHQQHYVLEQQAKDIISQSKLSTATARPDSVGGHNTANTWQQKQGQQTHALSQNEMKKRDEAEMDESLAAIENMDVESDLGDSKQVPAEATDAQLDSSTTTMCHVERHTEYDGHKVVKWGADNLKSSPGECCNACTANPDCNVWVWCGSRNGCGQGRAYKECWLKQATLDHILDGQGFSNPDIGWVSGAIYNDELKEAREAKHKAHLQALKNDTELPMVYLDVAIKGKHIGRIKIVLFAREAPLAAENFRQLCTGEKGVVPQGKEGAGKAYSLKGSAFYRIIDRFIDQTGANTESVYGGQFKDDAGGLALKHDRMGLLSMANAGPDTNTSHFSIVMAPAPHLDGHYTIFGEVVEGIEVAQRINALARGKPGNTVGPEEQAIIVDCGQIRGPTTGTASHASSH